MGHVDRCDTHLVLNPLKLDPHLLTQLEIEVRKRLIKEQETRLGDNRAGQRSTLLLPPRKIGRQLVRFRGQAHERENFVHPVVDLGLVDLPDFQRISDVLGHRHMRPNSVTLEHHTNVALLRRQEQAFGRRGIDHITDADTSAINAVQSRNTHQGGGLATTRRSQQGQKGPFGNGKRNIVHRTVIPKILHQILDFQVSAGILLRSHAPVLP